ncbi:MAG: hypothetical protein PHX18_07540 [Candidatus Gastranaerophilales bacterium]|nr:hypothetical protein [Candidatus Gastranaerophilales bacterium]
MSNENTKIGYALASSTGSGFIGAILVTDCKGFPLEFQYTDPILPTKIQQVLYGSGLEQYLKVDVILDSLMKVISNKVDILIVKDEQMLGYKSSKVDIVRMSPVNIAETTQENEIQKTKDNEYIVKFSKTSPPLRIQFATAVDENNPVYTKVMELTKYTNNFIDLTEPLERVQKTVELILSKEN